MSLASKISIIVPTLNRPKDLAYLLDNLLSLDVLPFEVIIVDQSDTEESKILCQNSKYNKLNINYYYIKKKSSAVARNYGIDHLSSVSNFVVFLDDDVTIDCYAFNNLISYMDTHPKCLGGIFNIVTPSRNVSLLKKIGFFLLTWSIKFDEQFMSWNGFNAMFLVEPDQNKPIQRCNGCGMFFRKYILDEGHRFPSNFEKYSLLEDVFFSYNIYRKHNGGLEFLKNVRMIHHETPNSRICNASRIRQHVIHFYLFCSLWKISVWKYMYTILILAFFELINKRSLSVISEYVKSMYFVFLHRKDIHHKDFDFNSFIFF